MKIAVTYDNGEVFQHFGHTEQFKVYNVEDGKVVSSAVIGSDGNGHEALAGLLSDRSIDVLICGGIGGGAQAALEEAGIELCSGASGSADEAVEAYLRGELVSSGVNCDHHHEGEEHSCGDSCGDAGEESCCDPDDSSCCDDDDGSCGGSCCDEGGCESCAGCHSSVVITGKNAGKTCRVHYRGTFDDGTQFDSSYDRGEPLEFVCGAGSMILGFDSAVADMDVGETIQIHLMPNEAYGEVNPRAFLSVEIAQLPGAENLSVDDRVYLTGSDGRSIRVRVSAIDNGIITFDANHEMAGKELNFTIELLEVLEN